MDPAKYRSTFNAFRVTASEEGVRTLARGWAPTLVGYSMQGMCKFGLYEVFKNLYSSVLGEVREGGKGGEGRRGGGRREEGREEKGEEEVGEGRRGREKRGGAGGEGRREGGEERKGKEEEIRGEREGNNVLDCQ